VNILDQARRGAPIVVHRGGERPWCYVDDTARAIAFLVDEGATGAWNVGRDDQATTLLEIAQIACRLAGSSEELIELVDPPNPAGVVHRVSTAKLAALGFRPEVELQHGLRLTLDWLGSRAS
jgi:dTDP-glucose 4,6-dehydratase